VWARPAGGAGGAAKLSVLTKIDGLAAPLGFGRAGGAGGVAVGAEQVQGRLARKRFPAQASGSVRYLFSPGSSVRRSGYVAQGLKVAFASKFYRHHHRLSSTQKGCESRPLKQPGEQAAWASTKTRKTSSLRPCSSCCPGLLYQGSSLPEATRLDALYTQPFCNVIHDPHQRAVNPLAWSTRRKNSRVCVSLAVRPCTSSRAAR